MLRAPKVLLILQIIVLSSIQPPDAHARFCAGEGARIRFLFERITHWADNKLSAALGQVHYAGQKISQYLPPLSLWLLHVNSRAALINLLEQAEMNPESLPDIEKLASALEPNWKLAAQINRHFFGVEIDVQPPIKQITEDIAIFWATCQAIKTVRPEPCNFLQTLDKRLKFDCAALLVRFGILYSGRCSPENLGLVAGLMQISPEKAGELCQVLKEKQGDKCRSVSSSTLVAQLCLALTGQGEAACKHSWLSESESRDCLRDLYAYQAVTGALSLESWEQQTDPRLMPKAAVYSVLSPSDCLEMAMRLFDQFDQFGGDFFLLGNRRWYQPPGMH